MIKVTHNNHYLEKNEAVKKAKLDEQYRELKSIIPEQGLMKRHIEILWGEEISIRDKRHRSLASISAGFNRGVEVARFYLLKKEIFLADRSLFDIVKTFAEKYGYEEINTEYQL